MPRKQYRADLAAASAVPDYGNVRNVRPGDDDGSFTFVFAHPASGKEDSITAMTEPSDYPHNHTYMIFASENASATTANALHDLPNLDGQPLQEALPLLSAFLTQRTATGGPSDPFQLDSDGDHDMPDSQVEHSDEDVDNQDWAFDEDPARDDRSDATRPARSDNTSDPEQPLSKARADLRRAKEAGFKVGVLGSLEHGCYISIACRVAKLGISEEAQDAWVLEPSDYVVLLMYFPYGYRNVSYFEAVEDHVARSRLQFKVGIGSTYRPRNRAEAADVFNAKSADVERPNDNAVAVEQNTGGRFRESFISRSLNELFKDRFIAILRYRITMGFSWTGAEKYYNETRGSSHPTRRHTDPTFAKPDSASATLPAIVTNDQIATANAKELSLLLLAMQFLMRHFVRCTEFCLVCHGKLDTEVEAIKPYVCESPLCLYQYMSLGFGPSIEHEIIAQPYVVDLLVSFCYASAVCKNLHNYPDGLGLSVPDPQLTIQGTRMSHTLPDHSHAMPESKKQKVETKKVGYEGQIETRFDADRLELLFENDGSRCPVKIGQWIVMNSRVFSQSWHCRVIDTFFYPTVRVTKPIILSNNGDTIPDRADKKRLELPSGWSQVHLSAYDKNINDCNEEEMCSTILLLLDLLPSVLEMRSFLTQRPGSSLTQWNDRISPAALGVLRWIIASNRSCIMQVDDYKDDAARKKTEEKVQNMAGWLQFRFAMGAPDKEQRFINSIKATTSTQEHPTLFAWHGSPLANWHSIIREGLHFKKTSHGRAYGHGCYHARDFSTSGGYSGGMHNLAQGSSQIWPQSVVWVSQAIALSEIVNAPTEFVSHHPFYVVAQLDWIQTRYLFIKPRKDILTIEAETPRTYLAQDPNRTPTGPEGKPLALPMSAIPRSRRKGISVGWGPSSEVTGHASTKKTKGLDAISFKGRVNKLTSDALRSIPGFKSNVNTPIMDDAESVQTETEDLDILFEPEAKSPSALPLSKVPSSKARPPSEPLLPFEVIPLVDLPLTPSPEYATTTASKRLQKDFRNLLKTQEIHIAAGTLHELGWYVDPEHVARTSNLYQWIAELHSFPAILPLAKDMQQERLQSVVLEIRFHATYPMSPPFIRVVRPRFLPFSMGGGGHVTAGGSICAQLLTNDGWTVVSDMESVLLQVRMAIMNLEPQPARLENVVHATRGGHRSGTKNTDYGVSEAVDAFKRACRMHGWKIPEGLEEIASTSAASTGTTAS